jgi:hypothetical protein
MQTPNDLGDKALGTAQNVGVLDDRINVSWCGIQMAEQCGAQAKVAADGGRQAASRGWVGMCRTPVLESTEPKPSYVCPGCLITCTATI